MTKTAGYHVVIKAFIPAPRDNWAAQKLASGIMEELEAGHVITPAFVELARIVDETVTEFRVVSDGMTEHFAEVRADEPFTTGDEDSHRMDPSKKSGRMNGPHQTTDSNRPKTFMVTHQRHHLRCVGNRDHVRRG